MEKVKNVLIVIGIIALILIITLVVVGIKVAWSILIWVLGGLIVLFVIGYIIYFWARVKRKGNNNGE
ncbi:MAG: hypothetical protein LIO79_00065 [Rikenellaceae bacterium]|nr:hypothetical protein [Rikenellaceae bacterium]